ncbi:single-stranded DNA-binding protein [Deinococcus cellulosilyticus]|uniref:Single-stranded DNA-binding protein n=1 Tax=Deinococcus cellulosilyticus (strain DSM 18568 / NBRC 106333 / KACC 11606 / 5516J-15) TaxID=1223518 RepID=A0A511N884_DEIC1|nr:single-stranded DNA-binding protein [Deinococcus cellulosilyticus]GEM48641.1 single-stranded DNA-binding protein [Deinococcus cellulosilyticus NBRC 106333 = KACC 11606]
MNAGYISGLLKGDVDLRYTPNGVAIASLQLVGERTNNEGRTVFSSIKVQFFDKQAERYAETLRDGDPLMAYADVRYRSWETSEGEKAHTINVNGKKILRVLEPETRDTEFGPVLCNCINHFTFIGNTTLAPELKYTPAGDAYCSTSVAYSIWDFKQKEETSHYIKVKAWREQANALVKARKGQPLLVEGPLAWASWTAPNGDPRGELQLVAEDFTLLDFIRTDAASTSRPTLKPKLDIDDNTGQDDLLPEEDLPF